MTRSHDAVPFARLPVRSEADLDETLPGYVLRLAEMNGFDDARWIVGAAGLPSTYAWEACDLRPLAALGGATIDRLEAIAFWEADMTGSRRFGRVRIPRPLLHHACSRSCPACLAGRRAVYRLWDLLPFAACPDHRTMLVDQCPGCGRPLEAMRPALDRCRCGRRLTASDAEAAPGGLILLSSTLRQYDAGEPAPPGAAPFGNLAAAARLAWFVASADGDAAWRSTHMSKPDLCVLRPMLKRAVPVILDWPDGLHAWLDSKRSEVPGRAGLAAEFGPWLGRLRGALDGPGSEEILAEAKAWLAGSWGRGISKKSSHLYARPPTNGTLTLREAGARLGISSASAGKLLRAGSLEGEMQAMGRRTLHRVRAESVERYAAAAVSSMDAAGAAARLGITPPQVDRLRGAGILWVDPMFVDGRRSPVFMADTVDALLARVEAASSMPSDEVGLVALDTITARRQVSLSTVIARVLRGGVRCFRTTPARCRPGLGCFAVALADAIAPEAVGARLSVREAARAIGLSPRMVPVLAAAGCIEAEGGPRLNRRGVTYATARDLGAATGSAARRMAADLASRGIKPVVASDTRAGVSAVWRRVDLGVA